MAIAKAQLVPAATKPEDPTPGDGSGESSNPDSSNASSQDGTGSEGKEATDEVPTTGDSAPIATISLLAVAVAGMILLRKNKK